MLVSRYHCYCDIDEYLACRDAVIWYNAEGLAIACYSEECVDSASGNSSLISSESLKEIAKSPVPAFGAQRRERPVFGIWKTIRRYDSAFGRMLSLLIAILDLSRKSVPSRTGSH